MANPIFWQNKRVFLTGHTGFKGSWTSIWLSMLGANVKGYALAPEKPQSLFHSANVKNYAQSEIGDIRAFETLQKSLYDFNPEIIIHMAAQPLVGESYVNPVATYETNVMGSLHLLEAARSCSALKAVINVTTDKCYENVETSQSYSEDQPMGGHDPYSSSKACAELLTSSYRRSFFNDLNIGIASARAGNVIGFGDWTSGRLVPDILEAFSQSEPVLLRNSRSIRPWQHVLEPVSGYLRLTELLYEDPKGYSEGWNFGPSEHDAQPVERIVNTIAYAWGDDMTWKASSDLHPHEASVLKLNINKAKQRLDWSPTWALDTSLQRITQSYKAWMNDKSAENICVDEIHDFMRDQNENT